MLTRNVTLGHSTGLVTGGKVRGAVDPTKAQDIVNLSNQGLADIQTRRLTPVFRDEPIAFVRS